MDTLIGNEMVFAGIVADVAHRVTKNGKPFGILTLEDYDSSHSFYLFSDDYLRFKEFMEPGWFLYITGTVIQNNWGQQRAEYKIRDIQLLAEIRDKFSKTLQLKCTPAVVDGSLIKAIEEMVVEHPGKCKIRLAIFDHDEKIGVELLSRKYMVKPADALLTYLEKVEGMEYELLNKD